MSETKTCAAAFDGAHCGPRSQSDMIAPGMQKGVMLSVTVDDDVRAARCLVPMSVYAPGRPEHSMCVGALIDTGASQSAVTSTVAAWLNLPVVGQNTVSGSGGPLQLAAIYGATVELWKPGYEPAAAVQFVNRSFATLLSPIVGIHLLIGMDLLQHATLTLADGRWTLQA